ncbi:MAG: enoyl-CoA hydratase/isomerase family protein, partial [Deltaproteobacteria bacterium]|nr:enoyl-CoA hydratase/isomerase family protein [Deltaproteobacteria bacterium]
MRLVQDLIGPGKAKELLFTAEYIDGKEAERIGLVNKAVPLDRLMDETREMAKKMAANSPFSIKMIKRGLNMARGEVSLEALMEYEVEACLACVSTKERQDSLKDFEGRER